MTAELDFGERKETAKAKAARLAAEAVEDAKDYRAHLATLTIEELVKEISPEFKWSLAHMRDWMRFFERVDAGESVLGLCAKPIQSGKTETTLHAIVWLLLRHPTWRFVVFTYSFDRAKKLGKRIRELARVSKVGPSKGWDTIEQWQNDDGGGVTVMSAEQSSLGEPCECLIFDDPLDEYGARDPKVRDEVDAAINRYTSRAKVTNDAGEVRQGSVLGVMSRWDPDDPYGRRKAREADIWEDVESPAIITDPDGTIRSFAEHVWPLALLLRKKKAMAESDPAEREWYAQFQNDPRNAIDSRFKQPARYTVAPDYPGFRYAMGVDLAYSPGEGDWFACVTVKQYGSVFYVVDVVRERADFNILENLIRNRWNSYGRCPIFSYISGPEKAAIRYFTDRGIPIQGMPARYNKGTRAQKTIDRWNVGRIQLPVSDSWVAGFLARVLQFTGSDKARDDDEIDALVSVVDGMGGTDASSMPRVFGQPRM